LLKAGADFNMTDRNGCTPLYKAAYHGRPVLVDILTQAGKLNSAILFPFLFWWTIINWGFSKLYNI